MLVFGIICATIMLLNLCACSVMVGIVIASD